MPKKTKKNIQTTTNAITNTNNPNRTFNWILNHPFKFLTFVLTSSAVFAEVISKISGRKQLETQLIPCGSNLEKFVPKTSIAHKHVETLLNKDCQNTGNTPLLFTKINAYAYAAYSDAKWPVNPNQNGRQILNQNGH